MSTHVSAEAPAPSFVSSLGNLLIAPREAFAGILRRPSPWLPLLAFVALHVVYLAVWLPKMDPLEMVRNQQEAAGQEVKLPPESAAGFIKAFSAVITLVAPPLVILATAGVLLLVFRFFYGGDVTFKQAFTIAAWSFLALGLVTVPLMLVVMGLKGEWSLDPGSILIASPAALLDRAATAKWLYAVAKALDLFSFWLIFLLASGF
ncbi:MAG: YIP1 family protein, partial [Vicinamibacteria bacterium]